MSRIILASLALIALIGCSSEPAVSGNDSMESDLVKASKKGGDSAQAWAPKGKGGMVKADKKAPPKGKDKG